MLCRVLLGLFFWLLCIGCCLGEIIAPDQIELGKLLKVTADNDADIFIWSIPSDIDYEVLEGNKKVICTGLEGSYKFELTTIKVDWDNKTFIQSPLQRKVIKIGSGVPPVPPPIPPVPPVPPVPPPIPPDPINPLTGIAKDVYDWSMLVPSDNRSAARELSNNYQDIATDLKELGLTIEQSLNELRRLNNQVLDTKEKKNAWVVVGSKLQARMELTWPMTKEEFIGFLEQVSLGFSSVPISKVKREKL